MKKALLLFFILASMFLKAQVVNFNMANSNQTVPCGGTFNFYDSGGPGGSYANSENFTAVFVPSVPGQCLKITFSAFGTESCCDPLSVYDGSTIAAPLLGTFQGGVIPPVLTSTSGSLCVRFTSDGSVIGTGWAAVISCTSCPAPPAYYVQSNGTQTLSCPPTYSLFYDSGGPASNYGNSLDLTKTFSTTAGGCLSFSFTNFSTESCCDFLRIYDGPTVGSPLIGVYSGVTNPGLITSTGAAITYSFHSDGSVVNSGWDSQIICVPSCTGTPAAGTAAATPSNACAAFNTTLTITGVAAACGLSYQWQSAAVLGGPYSNIGGATAATYTGNVPSTTYFRRLTMCGASTATSAVATASIGCPYFIMNPSTQTLACPPTYTLFYDSGGPAGSYNNSEDITKTFSTSAGTCFSFNFTNFSTESCCDFLRIYDGPTVGSPLIGVYSGVTNPGLIISTGAAITFSFHSDGSVNNTGWESQISCVPTCTSAPAAGTASASPSSSCASYNTTLSVTGVPSACGLTYQWQSAAAPGGPFSNIGGATAADYTVNIAATTYFRRRTMCGALTATSSVATASLSAPTLSCSLSTYNAAAITYSFENFVGTTLPTTDDVLFSATSTFGFPFCYSGQQFSGGYVASNSAFVFDAFPCNPNIQTSTYAAPGVGTGYTIPSPAPNPTTSIPRNAILGPWHDIHPGIGTPTLHTITLGTAPNRRFIVSWDNVPMYSCGTSSPAIYFTGQIKLFETSGDIEIHIQNKGVCPGFNSGNAVMGLHNYDGTIYRPPVNMTAHNAPTQWSMTNTAYRWTTSCPAMSNCAVPLPIEFKRLYGQHADGVNKLWWETAQEEEIKEFIVERSVDATNFTPINLTDAKGQPTLYSFNDNTFKRGFVNYYRVTGVMENGNKTLTSIYPIFNTDDKILINSIFPNPANDKLSVTITGKGAENNCLFIVYDQFGRIVLQKDQKINYGSNQADLNIESLEKGIYIIEIKTQDQSVISIQKFSKM